MTKQAFDFSEEELFLKVSPKLAAIIGLNEAIALQQIHYWLNPEHNKNYKDGHYWVYNSMQQWQVQFPFWSIDTIKKTLSVLEEKQLILRENLNPSKFTRVLWYTIDYEKLATLQQESSQECKLPPSKSANCHDRLEQKPPIEEGKLPRSKDVKAAHPLGQNATIEEGKNRFSYKEAKNTTENTTKNTNSPTSLSEFEVEAKSKNEREKKIKAQEMIEIFSKVVFGWQILKLNPQRIEQLWQVLTEQLEGKIENWKTVCQNITRSKFLMGESDKSNFRASLDWVLQDYNATKILEGNYGVGDRDVPVKRDFKEITDSIEARSEPEIMKHIRHWVVRSYGMAHYVSWFEPAEFVSFDGDKLVLQAPSQFVKEWLATFYNYELMAYLKRRLQKTIQVEFVAAQKKEPHDTHAEQENSNPLAPSSTDPVPKRTEYTLSEMIIDVTTALTNTNPKTTRKEERR